MVDVLEETVVVEGKNRPEKLLNLAGELDGVLESLTKSHPDKVDKIEKGRGKIPTVIENRAQTAREIIKGNPGLRDSKPKEIYTSQFTNKGKVGLSRSPLVFPVLDGASNALATDFLKEMGVLDNQSIDSLGQRGNWQKIGEGSGYIGELPSSLSVDTSLSVFKINGEWSVQVHVAGEKAVQIMNDEEKRRERVAEKVFG